MGRMLVYFANSSIPSRSANSVHVMKMCEALGRTGNAVTLIVPDSGMKGEGDEFGYYGVEKTFSLRKVPWIRKSPNGAWNYLYTLYGALLIKFSIRPDAVITRTPLAAVVFPRLSIPTIVEMHRPLEPGRIIARLASAFRVRASAHILKIVVISLRLKQELAGDRWPAGKIQVLHDGANLPAATPRAPRVGGHRFAAGYVGGLYAGRGIDIIIGLAARDPGTDYWIIGGTAEEAEYWKTAAGNPGNLHFRSHVPNREVPELLAGMDVLLMPYQRKVAVSGNSDDTARWMSPMKMFEYMAAGKAMIASDLEVLKEVLSHGENCLLAPPEDVDAWHAAVTALRDDPALASRLGERAKRDLQENYTWDTRAKRMLEGISGRAG